MLTLHRAAALRAYRTLVQGLGGSAVVTAAVASLDGGSDALRALWLTLAVTGITAAASFFTGIAQGLPEVDVPTQ